MCVCLREIWQRRSIKEGCCQGLFFLLPPIGHFKLNDYIIVFHKFHGPKNIRGDQMKARMRSVALDVLLSWTCRHSLIYFNFKINPKSGSSYQCVLDSDASFTCCLTNHLSQGSVDYQDISSTFSSHFLKKTFWLLLTPTPLTEVSESKADTLLDWAQWKRVHRWAYVGSLTAMPDLSNSGHWTSHYPFSGSPLFTQK